MKLNLSSLLGRKQGPSPAAKAAATSRPKSADELRRELRTAIERVGHGFFEFGEIAQGEAVANCRVFANRHQAIESIPPGGIVAEVGTQTGRFAHHIFRANRPAKLHLFDLSLEWFDQ